MRNMKHFTLAALVALFSFTVSAAVEPFAFFSFTNGTAGASAVGTIKNEINPGVNDMTITKASGTSGSTAFDSDFIGKYVYPSASVDNGVCAANPQSIRLASTSTSGQGGKFSILKAASDFSTCHGTTGFTFEMFFRILPSDKFSTSGYVLQALAGYAGKPFRVYFSTATQVKCGIGSATGSASGAATLPFSLKDGKWHHFAWVETATKRMEIWIDYVRYIDVEIPSSVTLSTTSGSPLDIANQYLQGRFSCFRLTKRALSSQEFLKVTSRQGVMSMSSDTLAFYPFDDGNHMADASSKAICSINSPFLALGQVSVYNSSTASVVYESDAPGKYVFSGRSYGAETIFENPASVRMSNTVNGASASISFQQLSTELSKCHSTGSTIEYFVKVCDSAMAVREPVLIADAGYYSGTTEKPLNFYIPYDGAKQVYYSLGDYGAGGASSGGMLPDGMAANGWHHVAIVEKGNKVRLYVDYVQYGEVALTSTKVLDSQGGTVKENVRDLVLGNYLQHCKLSCLRVMKRALEPSEFMYASNLPTCVPATVFQWPLDNTTHSIVSNIVSTFASANPDLYISKASTFTGAGTPSSNPVPDVGLTGKGRYLHCDVIHGEDPRRENKCCMYFSSDDTSPTTEAYRSGADVRIATDGTTELNDTGAFTAEGFFRFDRASWTNSLGKTSQPPLDKVVLMSRARNGADAGVVWSVSLVNAATPADTRLQVTCGAETVTSDEGKYGDGKWHHVAFTYDPATDKMCAYFDYRLVIGPSKAGVMDYGTSGHISVGNGTAVGGNNFMGWVDEIRYSCVCLEPSGFLVQENHRGASLLFH